MARTTQTVIAVTAASLVLGALAPLSTAQAAGRDVADACPAHTRTGGFPDVDPASTHGAAISCLAWWGVTAGTASGGYAPEAVVTRAQMASFLARTVARGGGTLPVSPKDAFTDDKGSPHERSMNQLAAAGIVLGRGDGTYAPGVPVRRDQMASFLVRAVEHVLGAPLPEGGNAFTDDDGNSHERAIGKAEKADITAGVSAGRYGMDGEVRRASMASFLVRTLDLLVESGPDWELDGYRVGRLLFGTPEDQVVATMKAAFGEPDAVTEGGCELGGPYEGRFYDWGDLSIHVYAPQGETPTLTSWGVSGTALPGEATVRHGLLPGQATRSDVVTAGGVHDPDTSEVFGSDFYFEDELTWIFEPAGGPLEMVSGSPVFCE